jgi:hypothetical protein
LDDIRLDGNPGLLNDAVNTQDFAMALSRSTMMMIDLNVSFCQMPGHALAALFQASAVNKTLSTLNVYDRDRLQVGQDRDRQLEIIPQTKLNVLHVNLDFTDTTVLSAGLFHFNNDLHRPEAITNGPVLRILRRNKRIEWALTFLNDEGQEGTSGSAMIIPWKHVIARFSGHESGLSATYTILRKKLPSCWWVPETTTQRPVAAAAAATTTAANSTTSHSTTAKRSHAQAKLGDKVETDTKSLLFLEPQQKRPRRPTSLQPIVNENEENGTVLDAGVSTYDADDEAKLSPNLTHDVTLVTKN